MKCNEANTDITGTSEKLEIQPSLDVSVTESSPI